MIQRAVHISAALGVAILFSASLHSCYREQIRELPRPADHLEAPPVLRVLVAEGVDLCVVDCDGPVRVLDGPSILATWTHLPGLTVAPSATGLTVGTQQFASDSLRIESIDGDLLRLNEKPYRGSLRFDRTGGGKKIHAINLIDMETYLWGVVGCEAYSNWPMATLEAQAIAARTYAYRQAKRRKGWAFDLRPTEQDQVYRGVSAESRRVTAAVNHTRGTILVYGKDHQPLMTFYGSCCGGHTTSASRGLGERDVPPLEGQPCPYCNPGYHVAGTGTPAAIYHWTVDVKKADLAAQLAAKGYTAQTVRTVKALDVDASGRLAKVEITTNAERPIVLLANDFRELVGFRKIKSTKLIFRDRGEEIQVEGFGWGHGVGLCQWGAKGMADHGSTARLILGQYYPGARLVRLYE